MQFFYSHDTQIHRRKQTSSAMNHAQFHNANYHHLLARTVYCGFLFKASHNDGACNFFKYNDEISTKNTGENVY